MKRLSLLLIILICYFGVRSQPCFQPFLKDGDRHFKNGNYPAALKEYIHGLDCPDKEGPDYVLLKNKIVETKLYILPSNSKSDPNPTLNKQLKQVDDDQLRWFTARDSYDPATIQQEYLDRCDKKPCKFKGEANALIDSLKTAQKNSKNSKDQKQTSDDNNLWERVKKSEDPSYIKETYIDQCNDPCHYIEEAEQYINELILRAKPTLKLVPGGKFTMGNNFDKEIYEDVKPHTTLVRDFYLGITEITFREYDAYVFDTKRIPPGDAGHWGRGLHPVINVTWHDAIHYCNWRSKKDGLDTVYVIDRNNTVSMRPGAKGYRLPTEAEWEYAARDMGLDMRYGNGQNKTDFINYFTNDVNNQHTVKVATLANKNKLGLYDMSGNVMEWCWDWYDTKYYAEFGKKSEANNPAGPPRGMEKALRGGSWSNNPNRCTVYYRHFFKPGITRDFIGFRVARSK